MVPSAPQLPVSCTWNPWLPGVSPSTCATTATQPPAVSRKVTVPVTAEPPTPAIWATATPDVVPVDPVDPVEPVMPVVPGCPGAPVAPVAPVPGVTSTLMSFLVSQPSESANNVAHA